MIRQRSVTREMTYQVIDGERDYQDDGKGNARPHVPGSSLNIPGSLVIIDKLLLDAKFAWYKPDGVADTLAHLRKIAAVAVQAMEIYGAPAREGYDPNL